MIRHYDLFVMLATLCETGADGEGRSDRKFVSSSSRLVITPKDWNATYALALAGIKPVPDQFTDEFVSPGVTDAVAVEASTNLAQGLPDTKYTLKITDVPETPIGALRIYQPPLH